MLVDFGYLVAQRCEDAPRRYAMRRRPKRKVQYAASSRPFRVRLLTVEEQVETALVASQCRRTELRELEMILPIMARSVSCRSTVASI